MSRDVAYRNGYLPLHAGAELIRRSGALTQFPAENLIGTLPVPTVCVPSSMVVFDGPLRPAVPATGIQLQGFGVYDVLEDAIRGALETAPWQCGLLTSQTEEQYALLGNTWPFSQYGAATPDVGSPANWYISATNPALPAGASFNIYTANSAGVIVTNHGFVVVERAVGGVVTVDTSSLTTPLPATFTTDAALIYTQIVLVANTETATFWPPWSSHFTGGAGAWVACINNGPCAALDLPFINTGIRQLLDEVGGQNLSGYANTVMIEEFFPDFANDTDLGGVLLEAPGYSLLQATMYQKQIGADLTTVNSVEVRVSSATENPTSVNVSYDTTDPGSFHVSVDIPLTNLGDVYGTGENVFHGATPPITPGTPPTQPQYGHFMRPDIFGNLKLVFT